MLLLVAGWLTVTALATLHVLQLLGVADPVPLDWAWAATPLVYLPGWFVLLLAGAIGSRSLGAAALVIVVAHVAWLLPAMTGSPAAVDADAPRLRVVSANVLYTNQRLPDLLDELMSYDADVIALQEVTDRVQVAVVRQLTAEYPHQVLNETDNAFGSMVVSRLPLRADDVLDVGDLPMLVVDVVVGTETVRVWNVHTRAPTRGYRRDVRDESLAAMEVLRADVSVPLVVLGDFNATRWNESFRSLLATGLRSAADDVGHGLRTTWKGSGGIPIEMVLDHVLVSDEIVTLDTRVGAGVGSDHRPVIADLALR
jgi:endonuclease/exonuclease/phosphatase (EEP) superfamily protein YafD